MYSKITHLISLNISKGVIKTILFGLVIIASSCRQNTTAQNYTIASYNVENLFDTFDDPKTMDEDFLPDGKYQWNIKRYNDKLENLSKVIAQLGDKDGPEIIALCEVENRKVVEDLLNTRELKKFGYAIIHQDSPDRRGIDVAFVYKEAIFKPIFHKAYTINFPEDADLKTRDFLLVSGVFADRDTLHFILNHWPSRWGGTAKSEYKRMYVASSVREVIDFIFAIDVKSKIIIMGDFNDEPTNQSIYGILKAKEKHSGLKPTELYNPIYHLEKENLGSYKFRGDWNMLDQIILSQSMLNKNSLHYQVNSATIFSPEWLKQHGKYEG
ncbi:MAG: endonuclease/exonuclease/phosphatase family protein, partial [Bacteroidetes bacterium]|nr:endonuclease/exonuclease/phosphatase family protein [Bacteroidota bacterium]